MNRSMIPLLAVLGCVAVEAHAQSTGEYTYTQLPMHEVYGINASGVAVGGANLNQEAVAFVNGQLIRLQAPGYTFTIAKAISDAGHIVGHGDFNNATQGLLWPSVDSAPIRISGPGVRISPSSVNSQGVVVGTRYIDGATRGFRWSLATGMLPLDTVGSTSVDPQHIAETGYVTGSVAFGDQRNNIARWSPDGGSGIVEWSGTPFRARNDGGIVGWDANNRSLLWSVSNTRTLLSTAVQVTDMSEKGRLIGHVFASNSPYRTPVTQATPTAALTYLPLPPEALGGAVRQVSSCGSIIGSFEMPKMQRRPALWTRATCDVQTTASVPEVRGHTLEEAAPVLRASNVFAGRTNYVVGPCTDINRIRGQSPATGTQVPTASSVELSVVINCSVAVPGLLGQTISGASSTLHSVGLVLGQVKTAVDNSCNYIGAVMSQSPTSGSLNWGSPVNVTIGQRPRTPCH